MAIKTCGTCGGSGDGAKKTDASGNHIGYHPCTTCGGGGSVHVADGESGSSGCLLVFALLGTGLIISTMQAVS